MPRPTRIEYENAFYHVMNRGRGRQTIFHDPAYFQLFLDTLKEAHERFDAVFHAYCLMGNHYHLLIETPNANLGRIMRHINGIYTQRHNRLRKTDGPLFSGRYKAILVDEDAYLLSLSRYIHRNPIAIKASQAILENYRWSSYPAYIGKATMPTWLHQQTTYQMLGHKQRYKGYRTYVEKGVDEEIKHFYSKGNIAAILGDKAFRESIHEKDGMLESIAVQATLRHRPTLEVIVKAVAQVFKLSESTVVKPGDDRRVRNDARKLAMYCCQQLGDIPLKEIAKGFGLSHAGSVSRLIHDAKACLDAQKTKRQYQKIERLLLVMQ